MNDNPHNRLRSPDERVGSLSQAALPPPVAPSEPAERGLLRALRARDEAAFESVVGRYYAPMMRTAARYVRSPEEAEEAVQDTWIAVLRGLDRFEGRSSLRTWIFRILVNRARTLARRSARTLPLSALRSARSGEDDDADEVGMRGPMRPGAAWDDLHWTPHAPEGDFDVEQVLARIDVALEALPPRQRRVLTLRDLDGWTAEQVCALHGISAANQRVLLHRARLRLKEALQGYDSTSPSSPPEQARAVA